MTVPIEHPAEAVAPTEGTGEVITRLTNAFARYAGWLGNDQPSNAVRTHAQALGRAVESQADPSTWIILLGDDLKRLPSGEVRKVLRRTLAEISAALESSGREGETERPA